MSRFEQAVHYIVDSTSAKPEELGKTKLAKVLFFADLEAFRRTGKPITEATCPTGLILDTLDRADC
jgi:hypothetical protein